MTEQLRFSRQPTIQTKKWATLFTVLTLLLCRNALADKTLRHYRIPAQPLEDSLMQVATDNNLRLLFTADHVRGFKAKGLDGMMTQEQALSRLLQGSGMTYRFVDAKTVTIDTASNNLIKTASAEQVDEPQTNGEGQVMPKVTVEANSDNPYDDSTWATDPYNKDYNRPNATTATKTDTPIMETPSSIQVIPRGVLAD